MTGLARACAAAGLAASCAAAAPPPLAVDNQGCRVSFTSGRDWTVYADDPTSPGVISGAPLGQAQPVCLDRTSRNCPTGAVAYGHAAPDAWTADPALDGAAWIWAPGVAPDTPADLARYTFVRRLDLERVGSAWLKLAADDFAEVRVNGTRVGAIGSVDFVRIAAAAHESPATFDLAPYLAVGTNTISVTAQNGPSEFAGCANTCRYRQNPGGVVFAGGVDVCGAWQPPDRRSDQPTSGAKPSRACSSAAASFFYHPNVWPGAWFYGWSPSLDEPFVEFETMTGQLAGLTDGDGLSFRTPAGATHPVAFSNPTSRVHYVGGTMSLQPGQLAMHPGPAGEYAIARWQANEPGRVTIKAEFFGLSGHGSSPPTTTDVHIRRRGGPEIARGALNLGGSGNSFRYESKLDVAEGDTIDFAVGFGNGTYDHDSTALDVTVCRF